MSKADEMNKELEETIKRMRNDCELAKSEDSIDIDIFTADIETVLNYIDNSISEEEYNKIKKENEELNQLLEEKTIRIGYENSISKEVIKKKIEELNEDIEDYLKTDKSGRFTRTNCIFTYKKEALQELLEGK